MSVIPLNIICPLPAQQAVHGILKGEALKRVQGSALPSPFLQQGVIIHNGFHH